MNVAVTGVNLVLPENPSSGEIYLDVGESRMWVYTGSEWICIASEGAAPDPPIKPEVEDKMLMERVDAPWK